MCAVWCDRLDAVLSSVMRQLYKKGFDLTMQKRSQRNVESILGLLFCLWGSFISSAYGEDQALEKTGESGGKTWYILTWENDLFAFSDNDYTNGVTIAWAYGPFDSFES